MIMNYNAIYIKKGCLPVALDELKTVMGKKRAFIVTDTFLYENGYTKGITDANYHRPIFAMLIVLASIGVPVFAPFISEILTIISALFSDLSLVLKLVSVLALPLLIISSCYMLKFLHSSFYGEKMGFEKIIDGLKEKINEY